MNESNKLFAKFALELIEQSQIPVRSPALENAMAVRQWLSGIHEGKFDVVPAAQAGADANTLPPVEASKVN